MCFALYGDIRYAETNFRQYLESIDLSKISTVPKIKYGKYMTYFKFNKNSTLLFHAFMCPMYNKEYGALN
jgi:hypothetical protein